MHVSVSVGVCACVCVCHTTQAGLCSGHNVHAPRLVVVDRALVQGAFVGSVNSGACFGLCISCCIWFVVLVVATLLRLLLC